MKYIFLLLSAAAALNANPKNHSVVNGDAKVSEQGNLMQIDASDRSILHWDSFSIGAGETTRFVLPSSSSAILNQVTGSQMSEIIGLLQSNGQVYLINQNGIVIGKEGRIDTAGFVASIYELNNTNFLNGESLKILGCGFGEIINLGSISTGSGPVVLIAHRIENSGTISAPEGSVSLNAGHEILLDPTGQGILFIRPDLKGGGIENNGTIEAYKTQLQADATPTSLAIGLGGLVDAGSVKKVGGEIYLVAKEGSIDFRSTGKLSAGNEGQITLHAEKGMVEARGQIETPSGTVHLLGEKVHLLDNAYVNVSGESKGGTVLVGGDYQGNNPDIPNSQGVYLGKNARIDADATVMGDGGKIILWGDVANGFFGNVSAQGGKEGGDGGFVEVSSMGNLSFNGLASTLAAKGKVGKLLLDPTNVVISSAVDNDDTPGAVYAWTGPAVNVNTTVLNTQLTMGDVAISTSAAVDQGQAGTITISSPLTLVGPNTLSLASDNIFTVNADINCSGTSGGLQMSSSSDMTINNNITCSGAANVTAFASNNLTIASTSTINWSSSATPAFFNANNILAMQGSINCSSNSDFVLQAQATNLLISGSISLTGTGTLFLSAFMAGAQIGFLNGSSVSTQTAMSFTPSSFLNLTGTVTISTPSTLTLSSAVRWPQSRGGIAATLNASASTLSFPVGINDGNGLPMVINNLTGNITVGGDGGFAAAFTMNAHQDLTIQGVFLDQVVSFMTLTAGGNLIIDSNSNIQVEMPSVETLLLQAGTNISLGNGIFIQGTGPVNLIAGVDIIATGTTGTIRTALSNDLNLVADNRYPRPDTSPNFGSGKFNIPNGYTLCTNNCVAPSAKVYFYGSVPGISTIPTTINVTGTYTPGHFSGNTYNLGTNEFLPYWYITQPPPDPPLFEVIFKSTGLLPPAAVQAVVIALTEPVSNPPQIANVTEGNLTPPSKPDPKTKCGAPGIAVQASL